MSYLAVQNRFQIQMPSMDEFIDLENFVWDRAVFPCCKTGRKGR